MRNIIGVIGGNGVAATNKLCSIIEEHMTRNGAFRDAHHPEMIVWQATQAPSRSMYLEGRGPSFIEDYVDIAQKMKACGVTHLCMCCNTAHYYINEIEKQIGGGISFINIIEEVVKTSLKTGKMRYGVMCSDGLRKVELYDKWFKHYNPSAQIIYPDEEFQKKVTEGICNAKNNIRFNESHLSFPAKLFAEVESHLRQKEADVVIGGCTDIRNVYQSTSELPYVDSLEVLAESIININKK